MRSWSGLKLDNIMILRVILLPVKSCQSDAVNYICRDIVEDQRLGGGLQSEVGDQGVVGEDLHLVAGHVLVQLPQGGLCPADHSTGGVGELQSDICWRKVWNCREREIRARKRETEQPKNDRDERSDYFSIYIMYLISK